MKKLTRREWIAPTLTIMLTGAALPLKARGGYGHWNPPPPPPKSQSKPCMPDVWNGHKRYSNACWGNKGKAGGGSGGSMMPW